MVLWVRLFNAHTQIEPCGLPGDRVGIRPAQTIGFGWQQFMDEMV